MGLLGGERVGVSRADGQWLERKATAEHEYGQWEDSMQRKLKRLCTWAEDLGRPCPCQRNVL